MHELDRWKEEKNSAWLYRILSDHESGTPRQLLFLELAQEADGQAELWLNELRKTGSVLPEHYIPGIRVRVVAWLIRNIGSQHIKPVLAAMKIRGLSVYSRLRPTGYSAPTAVSEVGTNQRDNGISGGLRAAVFDVNDGLVSITLLVMGMAGATSESATITFTGVAGLLAGAFSMAAGEWISMRSQREMFEYQISLERDELVQYPAEETAELALIYAARGMGKEEAHALATRMIAAPEMGLDTLAREELGLNPERLGSPWQAAIFSFFAFIFGGLVPLLPFLLEVQRHRLLIAILLSFVAMFAIGATLSLFTGRRALWGGLRMLLIGGVAGTITYFIGNLMGAKIS
jgi:VIT1/CCC1 family predicted Fe2+/Mn2+ transporter